MSIGDNIRCLRKKAKLTQKELAQKIGVNEVTIRSYERGKYKPKNEILFRLTKALNCNINEILDKPFPIPDFKMDDYDVIEDLDGVMIPKKLSQEKKEEFKNLFRLAINNMPTDSELDAMYKNAVIGYMDDMNKEGQLEVLKYAKYTHSQPEYKKKHQKSDASHSDSKDSPE